MDMNDRDLFTREDAPEMHSGTVDPWVVLVVDDDPQVHAMSRLLLGDFVFEGRPFAMISAFSAAEAKAILADRPDIPVILLDVVMESHDAGLALVRHIRHELGNRHVRIILRTGQPGQAPEREVIVAYDINDYKAKSELTAQKLFTSLIAALRGWRDITTIERLNRTLERRVAERTAELARERAQAEEQRRFIETLVELMPSPVWYEDAQGRRSLCNRAFRELFPQAMLGEPGCSSGQTVPAMVETSVTDPQGATRELLVVRKALSAEEGGPQGVIGIATDITERRRMERDLHRLAITDSLSGVHNRRHLFDIVAAAVGDAGDGAQPYALIMLDIDHFKRINDEHGHASGDRTIETVSAEIRRHLRATDSVGRVGGEEFAVFLPGAALNDAGVIAERIRAGIAGVDIHLPSGRNHKVTASLGVTQLRPGQDTVESLLHRADQALYRAKAQGRNRVDAG